MNRRGVTLLELLVVLGLASGVVLAGVAVLRASSSAERRAAERLTSSRLTTTVGSLLRYELVGLSVGDVALSGPSLFLPRRVGEAFPCVATGAGLIVADREWHGVRRPEGGRDEAWATGRDGLLQRIPIREVIGASCPDGRPGWQVLLDQEVAGAGYLQVVERGRLASYASGGKGWFGLAPADGSASIQPLAGPIPVGCHPLQRVGQAVQVAACGGIADTTTIVVALRLGL